jgi:redox-sensing transcriptional repressor
VARLPLYLRALNGLAERGTATVSSEDLAVAAGVNSAKLRKDLSHLGSYGTRGVGYDVQYLIYQISRELGLTQDWAIAIVGVGNLGRALANYGGFVSRGFRVAALVDADPAVVGERIAGLVVEHIDDLENVIKRRGVSIVVIATPAQAAQEVADRVIDAGVTSILNFAPVVLSVPEGVEVRKVDLAIELQILAFHEQRKAERAEAGATAPRGVAAEVTPPGEAVARAAQGEAAINAAAPYGEVGGTGPDGDAGAGALTVAPPGRNDVNGRGAGRRAAGRARTSGPANGPGNGPARGRNGGRGGGTATT